MISLFNKNCVPISNEFRVNTHTDLNQAWTSMAMNDKGEFVIAWQSEYQDMFDSGVFAQKFEILKNSDIELCLNNNEYSNSDNLELELEFYYGQESQFVDLYWIILNQSTQEILFFPDWEKDISKASIYISQYHFFPMYKILETKLPSVQPPIKNYNKYTFAVAFFEKNTMNLLSNIATVNFEFTQL